MLLHPVAYQDLELLGASQLGQGLVSRCSVDARASTAASVNRILGGLGARTYRFNAVLRVLQGLWPGWRQDFRQRHDTE